MRSSGFSTFLPFFLCDLCGHDYRLAFERIIVVCTLFFQATTGYRLLGPRRSLVRPISRPAGLRGRPCLHHRRVSTPVCSAKIKTNVEIIHRRTRSVLSFPRRIVTSETSQSGTRTAAREPSREAEGLGRLACLGLPNAVLRVEKPPSPFPVSSISPLDHPSPRGPRRPLARPGAALGGCREAPAPADTAPPVRCPPSLGHRLQRTSSGPRSDGRENSLRPI